MVACDVENPCYGSGYPTVEGEQKGLNTTIDVDDQEEGNAFQQPTWQFIGKTLSMAFVVLALVWTRQLSQRYLFPEDGSPKIGVVTEIMTVGHTTVDASPRINTSLFDNSYPLHTEVVLSNSTFIAPQKEQGNGNESSLSVYEDLHTSNQEVRNETHIIPSDEDNNFTTAAITTLTPDDDEDFWNETASTSHEYPQTPTLPATSMPQGQVDEIAQPFTGDDYKIHVVYDDWKYRRVCALVGTSSHLCMTVRYPFPVDPMDLSVDFASPTETRWYTSHRSPTIIVLDGPALEECKQMSVKDCLDYHYDQRSSVENTSIVIAVYTRTRNGQTSLFGTTAPEQRTRIQTFFRNQVVIVFGASPTPPITECMKSLFGTTCDNNIMRNPHIGNCTSPGKEEDWVVLGLQSFYPTDISHGRNHSVTPGLSVNEQLFLVRDKLNITLDVSNPLKFTIIIEHPIAHTQNQPMMQKYWDYVVSLQGQWTHVFLDSIEEGPMKDELSRQGIEIANVIAFDGSPQFFPSESGGFMFEFESFSNEQDFRDNGGYPGWDPKYGSTCTGPLHPSSNLTKLNDAARIAYQQNGLDMRWYGRAWEFMNLVWFDVMGWGTKGIDCTHTGKVTGALSCMHKFFLMAMVDDHFDNKEE